MRDILSRMLGGPDGLTRLARGRDRPAFVEAFGRSELVVLSNPLPTGLDPAFLTPKALLAEIEAAVKAMVEADAIPPFYEVVEGVHTFPVFSRAKWAERFISNYVRQIQQVLPFEMLTLPGTALVPQLIEADQVILNPRSKHPYLLTDDDLQRIVAAWPEGD